MIRNLWRRSVRFLGSAGFATSLLIAAGAWSALGSLVPQGAATTSVVTKWATAHAGVEPVVNFLGLHQAYGAPVFIACIIALALSTTLCAWRRTRAALNRSRALREAGLADREALLESHDFEIVCDRSLDADGVLGTASATLADLGIATKERDGVIVAASAPWSVWGSPIFHWSLLLLIVALIVGNLLRAEGLMGVAVGQTKADAPASYGLINAGPLHNWNTIHRSFRVDAFDPAFTSDGIKRGPTPTVSLLDGTGAVVLTQQVYPNHTLKNGSLTVYPSDYGLSARFSLTTSGGVPAGSIDVLVDFSSTTTGGTQPIDPLDISDTAGNVQYRAFVTVPLDVANGFFVKTVPAVPRAELKFADVNGSGTLVHTMRVGDSINFPTGATLRLDGIGYYARLSVVDDWSIPLLYLALGVAMLGLTLAVVARQQIVAATVVDGPEGLVLAVRLRMWRNVASSRGEIESELSAALGTPTTKDVD